MAIYLSESIKNYLYLFISIFSQVVYLRFIIVESKHLRLRHHGVKPLLCGCAEALRCSALDHWSHSSTSTADSPHTEGLFFRRDSTILTGEEQYIPLGESEHLSRAKEGSSFLGHWAWAVDDTDNRFCIIYATRCERDSLSTADHDCRAYLFVIHNTYLSENNLT